MTCEIFNTSRRTASSRDHQVSCRAEWGALLTVSIDAVTNVPGASWRIPRNADQGEDNARQGEGKAFINLSPAGAAHLRVVVTQLLQELLD